MKFILKGKYDKSATGYAYRLVGTMGIAFVAAELSLPLAIALIIILLTGSFL